MIGTCEFCWNYLKENDLENNDKFSHFVDLAKYMILFAIGLELAFCQYL